VKNVTVSASTGNATKNGALPFDPATSAAASAALLEIGDRLGVLPHIDAGQSVSVEQLADAAGLPEEGIANYPAPGTILGQRPQHVVDLGAGTARSSSTT
jgi:hypothetical protein